MREIKFRAWDRYRNQIVWPLSDEGAFLDGSVSASTTHNKTDGRYDMPLMQYTGLKDKNGVEIYEGDIVTVNGGQTTNMGYPDAPHESLEWTGQVGFSRAGFYISGLRGGWPHIEDTEVIGNIYENPELLK